MALKFDDEEEDENKKNDSCFLGICPTKRRGSAAPFLVLIINSAEGHMINNVVLLLLVVITGGLETGSCSPFSPLTCIPRANLRKSPTWEFVLIADSLECKKIGEDLGLIS